MMAKKKIDTITISQAELWGTLARVHTILKLQGASMIERYEAVNDWCREQDRKRMENNSVRVDE
jgi:hypothetical protein